MAFNISQPIDVRSRCANIDVLYGPYNSMEEACTIVIPSRRVIGRTVGIIDSGSIIEYWWKAGIEDSDLVRKVEQLSLSLRLVGESSITADENETILGRFLVEGGSGIKRAVLYQVVDGNEIFVQDYTNIGKGSPYTFVIPNPSLAGIYTYHIKVIDSLDNYAITTEGLNYVEYTVSYGGISTIYNFTQINAITVKNYTTVANQPFQLNISIRDDTFRISNVCLTDITDDSPSDLSIPLTPSTGNFIGNNTYYMPNEEQLIQFNGKQCSIVVSYTESGSAKEKVQDLFKLLDISTLELVPEYEGGDYYATLPSYYVFKLLSGVENLSIVLTPGENSDFSFERSTVLSYRRYSLRVIPNDIVKNNAQIVINYRYIYDNIEYTGSFTRTIGNIIALPPQEYYNPADGSNVSRITLVDANSEDYTDIEDGQYYKVISEETTDPLISSSFILDTYCKINQQNDKSIKYITITYGGIEVASVTEDEISCVRQWRSLYTDTPINEWTQIGIGVNLQESIRRNNNDITGYYHSIYINGMIVKTVRIDGTTNSPLRFNSNNRLVVTIGNGILVQKCFLYYRNDGQEIISPNTNLGDSIIYNNFKSHRRGFSEPQDLPILRFLRINDTTESSRLFGLINTYKENNGGDKMVHLTTFGNIGDTKATTMAEYDPYYDSQTIESNATLFRQSVEIKKPAQKEYAVLCHVQWMGQIFEDIIVEVHTQGTSTLVYSIPNFKFTFWRISGNLVSKYYPPFIQKEGSDDYYQEYIYTAKADFMDSSHLNNTPTCIYYNDLIQNLIEAETITGSPSARNGMLDAILGFPIVMEISDTADDFGNERAFTNIGSFMLNIDKTGDSLGFEIEENGETLSCISFEGTSNDNDSGASGRFDIPDGVELKDYTNNSNGIDEYEIIQDYNFVRDNIINQKGLNDTVVYDGQQILVRNQPYVKWCLFISDGLEYRYPDSDIYKEKNDLVNKVMKVDHFIALYKMWWWVYKSDTLTPSDYREQFQEHFDLQYCMIYFINLMTYAQTDNLGKNAMFDCWDGEHWYPRPYDLDSETGLDNNGNDNIAPFVEIKPEFSLNYDIDKATDYEWLSENYLIDEDVTDPVTGITYQKSRIQYGTQTYDRYHFSSNNSKLWINFYKNFKDTINSFYADLRNSYGYGPETIIELCDNVLISKLGTAQYNKDFQNKYLANTDQTLAYGNRWYKFKKWITKRFAFCDSYFGAMDTALYNITSRINYNIKVDAPQYVAQQYQGNRDTRFVLDEVSFNAGSGAATIITLLVNQPSVFETSLFKNVVINPGSGAPNYRNLITLDVSGNNNPLFTNITSLTGTSLNNLKYLNISNSAVQNLDVPINVKTLLAENVSLNTLTIPSGCAVEEISLNGSTILGDVTFENLPNLTSLNLTDCVFDGNVTLAALPQLSSLTMTRAIFRGTITINDGVSVRTFDFSNLNINEISFSGTNLNIDTINFHQTKFGVSTLNLNAICRNIKNLYFDNCSGLTHLQITDGGTFDNLECFSIRNCPIKALGSNSEIFDCSHFDDMSSLTRVNTYNQNGTVTTTNFTFRETSIEKIINLDWTGSCATLFYRCTKLKQIYGTINARNSMSSMFRNCYDLTTLPNIIIDNSVTNASYIFAGANSLNYDYIADIINACTNVTDFSNALRCKQFNMDDEIELDYLFESNSRVTNINGFLSSYRGNNEFPAVENEIYVSGKIPSTVTTASSAFYNTTYLTIQYDILENASSLTNAEAMFALSTVDFIGDNRPVVTDTYGVAKTLSYAIDKNFLTSSLVNVSQMFYGSNVITVDPTLFANLSNLTSANATFGRGSVSAFSFINSRNGTELIKLDVTNMWANNPALTTIAGCFANIYTVFCSDTLVFHPSITSNRTIDISGLFGLSSNTNNVRDVAPISIDIDSIIPCIRTRRIYAVPNNTSYQGPGVFQNRSVTILSNPNNGQIFSKLGQITSGASQDCVRLFNGAVLYLPSNVTTFNLTNVISSCESMFEGCRLYTNAGAGHVYDVTDRKFVNVILPTNCPNYQKMFMDSSVLLSLPSINSSGAQNLSYMYSGCVINDPALELPSDYFEICASSLSNTSYMFNKNKYITTLEYDEDRGLFEGCVNLSNVSHMFSEAAFLHKGIPVNFFGVTPLTKLTSLDYMFGQTTILFDVEDYSYKWINSNTIAPLVNLDNIQGMFYRIDINSALNQYSTIYHKPINQTVKDINNLDVAVIDPSTFTTKSITNITKLFEHTNINPPTSLGYFRFIGFKLATDAFFDSAITNISSNFVESSNVSAITNADRMFYQVPGNGHTITNLSTFVNDLIRYPNISKYNIAGNNPDTNIPEDYRAATTAGDQNTYSGVSLSRSSNPEGTWTEYGRYEYA